MGKNVSFYTPPISEGYDDGRNTNHRALNSMRVGVSISILVPWHSFRKDPRGVQSRGWSFVFYTARCKIVVSTDDRSFNDLSVLFFLHATSARNRSYTRYFTGILIYIRSIRWNVMEARINRFIYIYIYFHSFVLFNRLYYSIGTIYDLEDRRKLKRVIDGSWNYNPNNRGIIKLCV